MTPQDFDYLRKMLRERSGLVLSAEKQYLAESRLLPVARKHGLGGLAELVAKLKAAIAAPLDRRSGRGDDHQRILLLPRQGAVRAFPQTIMPALLAARAREKRIRIWCTACATGQEPYSLAMSLKGIGPALAGWRVEILATDISNEVLAKAKAGIYSQFEVQRGLPIQQLVKFFSQVGEAWQIAPEIRAMVQFRPLNLLNDFSSARHVRPGVLPQRADLFRPGDQDRRAQPLARQMPADGFLVLGAAETVVGLTDAFKPMADKRGLYVPNTPAARPAPASNVLKFAMKA